MATPIIYHNLPKSTPKSTQKSIPKSIPRSVLSFTIDSSLYEGLATNNKNILEAASYRDTEPYRIRDKKFWAKCVNIYDGDTAHFAIIIHNKCRRITCRIDKIDTPK